MSNKYEICPECSHKMLRDERPETLTYKNESIIVNQSGWYCSNCEEVLLTSKDVNATEPTFLKLKAKVENLLQPEEIKSIRKQLKLSQTKAGDILGGGPRAFYKYENSLTLLSRAMNNQLILLSHNPQRIKELEVNK